MSKYMTTAQLVEANNASRISYGVRRRLLDSTLRLLDPDGLHVITTSLMTDDAPFVRCSLLIKPKDGDTPLSGWVDVPIVMFNELPEVPSAA